MSELDDLAKKNEELSAASDKQIEVLDGAVTAVVRERDELRAALEQSTAREAVLREALVPFLTEPEQVSEPFLNGPELSERLTDEWVCIHCGNRGTTATNIAHDDDCTRVRAIAALAQPSPAAEALLRVVEAAQRLRGKHDSRGDWVDAKIALDGALAALDAALKGGAK